ncbi:MAG TPA: DNA ligase D [Gemmatimonadaceae bacterium]|nr:DNA ligase D [Gemmatimonadaceae bacterium]
MTPDDSGAQPPKNDHLSAYRAKRSSDTSPEPVGSVSPVPGRLFVVHKHAARQLHFDLRLEMDGVLRSWAVPKGPSYDMNDKRLAVKVEDHPLEYGDFEGVIPEGNYGAGGVIVWDRGEWIALEDWREGLVKGKLLFEFHGYKLHGKWTLVKIKKSERDWLLIKERDAWMRSPGTDFPEESVLSGLTVEEVKEGRTPAGALRAALEQTAAVRHRVDPKSVSPTLAEPADKAFTRDGWLFELKLDGYRLIASKTGAQVLLLTRNGNDYTAVFPEVARAVKALPFTDCIIDGEVVVMDSAGKPSFARLQQRGRMSSPLDIKRAAVELPAEFFVFDFLSFEDFDLRPLPLAQRKALLLANFPKLGAVRVLDHIEREGEAMLSSVSAMGLEGIIAKRADSKYAGGRTDAWLKIKTERTGDFVIVGFTEGKGSRAHFGALQLADMVGGTLCYAGRAGTGFDDKLLGEIKALLDPLVRADAPCMGPATEPGAEPLPSDRIPETKTTTWVEPRYVCEVRFAEWTPDGFLRHPTFLRMRSDKEPRDCERQGWSAAPRATDGADARANELPAPPPRAPVEKTVAFSNLKKVYWPAEGYTKGDMVEYYRAISKWMLPYLRDRPLVLTRFPDGIDGKSFYQKDAPEFAPSWVRTVPIWSEDTQREIRYFVCDDLETLLYVANMGSIPMHIWASRVGSLEQPDWCVIDLDPKDAPFSDVIRTAIAVHELCDAIGWQSHVKTTGKTGLHILVPLAGLCTYAQSRAFGELIARLILRKLGETVTITRQVMKRGVKVYLDYLQNRHGQTIVSPFSVRPLPGATVSMPLLWSEVNESLDPRDFTIRNAVERMEKLGEDPVRSVMDEVPDLATVLQRLSEREK